jgi:hypothetical protein
VAIRPRDRDPVAVITSRGRCAIAVATVLAAGCSSGPPAPDWQINAKHSLERATAAWLVGDSRAADSEFTRARSQLARTGQPALVAQSELLHCAARVAALDYQGCPAFDTLAPDARPEQLAYARYLDGKASAADVALLPASQRALASAGASASAIGSATDPLSALVAAGVAFRRGEAGRATADAAIAHASRQGWRRPLLAWLLVRHRDAEASGDRDEALRLQRRIDLLAPATPVPR